MYIKKERSAQVAWDTLVPYMIAIAVLILILMIYLILSGKLENIGTFIKNALRLGR